MKKHFKHTILLVGCAAMLAGCDENEWNDKLDGFEVPPVYTDTETYNYTLTAADYTSIANSKVNKAIAEAKGESAVTALAAIGTNACFATAEEAREYIPALLSLTTFPYFTAENVKITYDLTSNQLPEVLAINAGVKTYDVTKADYQSLWGSTEDFIMGFAPATGKAEKILPELLAKKYTDAEAGEYAVVNYNYTDEDPDFNAGTTYFEETFAASIGGFTMENIQLPEGSTYVWSYDTRGYAKASAFVGGQNRASDSWLVSPEIELPAEANASLSFDQAWNYFADQQTAKNENSVAIRIVGETNWTVLTPEATPTGSNWTFVNSGALSLAAFNGKKIQIGFHYT
ncbi:MAG: choice-of-anchor J domain-containing protein, partial [Duncaniella sp.]|nr:choice-of-anchor J domain-containing protein [Duncaniella sp.]